MILPTADDIAKAKAFALAKWGRDELLDVRLSAPIDFCLLVAPLGFRAWCTAVDEQARSFETAKRAIVVRQLVWPSLDVVLARCDRRPAAPGKAFKQLLRRGGDIEGNPEVELLADVVARAAPDQREALAGLSLAKARELLAEASEAELWAVIGPHPALSAVMATPDPDVFLAHRVAAQRASAKQERIVETSLDFLRNAVRWSARPLDELLEDLPALQNDLRAAWSLIGGEGAEASSKSV